MSRSEERTERPTERRKREARREGRVAKSQEVGAALSLVSMLVTLRALGPIAAGIIADRTRSIFSAIEAAAFSPTLRTDVMGMLLGGLVPFLGLAAMLGAAGGLAQVGFVLSPKAIQPKLSNLSLKRGLNRFKPTVAGWELLRTALKLGLLALVVWVPLSTWAQDLGRPLGLAESLDSLGEQMWSVVVRASALAIAIAGADYAVVRFRTSKELRMTKQEMKEEYKRSEGDPLVKQSRRRRAAEMSRNRMIMDVASADVVITNPTRLAVALRYDPGEPAPRVVAKGANKLAAKIRGEAYRNGVAVVEDKPLARSLFRKVKVGQFVPTALFEAVAVILAVAYRRRRRPRALV